ALELAAVPEAVARQLLSEAVDALGDVSRDGALGIDRELGGPDVAAELHLRLAAQVQGSAEGEARGAAAEARLRLELHAVLRKAVGRRRKLAAEADPDLAADGEVVAGRADLEAAADPVVGRGADAEQPGGVAQVDRIV